MRMNLSKLFWLITLFIAIVFHHSFALKPLPSDQAFQLIVSTPENNAVQVEWRIAPGYYLYVEKLQFKFDPVVSFEVSLPPAATKLNFENIKEKVYSGTVVIPILLKSVVSNATLTI